MKSYSERRRDLRARVERMWREGVPEKEIARRVGWKGNYIANYRAKGWDLPNRHSAERVQAYKEARWPVG